MQTDVVLLPGLHGTTALFDTFIALAPPWAKCRPIALPADGDQTFDALAQAVEPGLRALHGFVLFAESFSAPIAARIAHQVDRKVALLVLCNPLVDAPLVVLPSLLAAFLRFPRISTPLVAATMTGGDRVLARSVIAEARSLPKKTLERRGVSASSAGRMDLLPYLAAPLLVITSTSDRLVPPGAAESVVREVPFAVSGRVTAPHLAAQIAPAAVWALITEEFERAA